MERTYQAKRSVIFVLLACILFFVGMFVFSVYGYFHDPKFPLILLIASCALWSFMTILSLCGILGYWKHRLFVTEHRIERIELLRTRSIELRYVTEARWRGTNEMGKLVLRTAETKLAIDLSAYQIDQQKELVKFFRHRLPLVIQRDWEKFWRLNWMRFDDPDMSNPEETREETRKIKLRMLYLVLGGNVMIALCSFLVWLYTAQNPNVSKHRPPGESLSGMIVANVFFIVVGGSLVYAISASNGKVRKQHPVEEKGVGLIAFGYLGVFLTMPAFIGMSLLLGIDRVNRQAWFIACISVMLLFFIPLYIGGRKRKSYMNCVNAEAAKVAEELYMKLPEGSEKERG